MSGKQELGHTQTKGRKREDFVWYPIQSAPKDGTRIYVCHDRATYSCLAMATAVFENGEWQCSERFINPHTMEMYSQPTDWRPMEAQP